MNDDRLEKSLQHLCWRHAAGAVLDVFRENESQEERRGVKASADLWCIRDDLRGEIHRRAAGFWARRTGLGPAEFPYTVDTVARLYFRFRKRNQAEVAGFAREIDGYSPATQR
jgi:hypothetical protein